MPHDAQTELGIAPRGQGESAELHTHVNGPLQLKTSKTNQPSRGLKAPCPHITLGRLVATLGPRNPVPTSIPTFIYNFLSHSLDAASACIVHTNSGMMMMMMMMRFS